MVLTENGLKLFDILVKGVFGALIMIVVAVYGSGVEKARQGEAEANKALQAAIELTSKQKDLDVELGMRMFGTLMNYYFQNDKSEGRSRSVREQMLLLRLVALNFHDVPINLKPLFEELDKQLTDEKDREELKGIAQEVARRQAFRLTVENGFDSGPITVTKSEIIPFTSLLMTVKIEDLGTGFVKASIISDTYKDWPIGPFSVSYFDLPIVDNTMLRERRVALILLEAGEQKAKIRFIAFPKHLAVDRFDIKELSRVFRDKPG